MLLKQHLLVTPHKLFKSLLVVLAIFFSIHQVQAQDFKFINLNLMAGYKQTNPFAVTGKDTYLEIEFGGKSGRLELYGYVDLLDVTQSKKHDSYAKSNLFLEAKPRIKIANLLGENKPYGSLYVSAATVIDAGNAGTDSKGRPIKGLWHNGIGLGTQFYFLSVNLYALYKTEDFNSSAQGKFDGYKLELSWFKPIYNIDPNTFLAYQGYFNYAFLANKVKKDLNRSSDELQWFNGFYLHHKKFAVGYGLKVTSHMGFYADGIVGMRNFNSSDISHYVALQYKM
ncbi:Tsx family outer membrane protein [Candidatus Hepatincolaceae symbiont of Richtersius coronifer]